MSDSSRRGPIAIYVPHLSGGGSEINALKLAVWLLEDGHEVDLVVHDAHGRLSQRIPAGARVFELSRAGEPLTRLHMLYAFSSNMDLFARSMFIARKKLDKLLYLPSLVRYLRRRKPRLFISNLWQLAVCSICARAIVDRNMPVVCIFRSAFFNECGQSLLNSKRPRKWRRFLEYCGGVYSQADAIVTVSQGIANDLNDLLEVNGPDMRVIHDPVIDTAGLEATPPERLAGSRALIIAVGRLSPEKNFSQLIDAYARLPDELQSRTELRILGDGMEREKLEEQIQQLGLASHVTLAGWVDDPNPHLREAALFVSTSRWEGFGNAIVEALAHGCPVVAFDCPHGPREILADGKFGLLVPVDDVPALTLGIQDALSRSWSGTQLVQRARVYSVDTSASAYRRLIDDLLR